LKEVLALAMFKREAGNPTTIFPVINGTLVLPTTCYNIPMNIRIRYFASLREITGQNEEALALPDGTTVAALRETLLARYPGLQTVMERALCAVNHQYVSLETVLREGDEVVFIPPVGGGCRGGGC
jgi:sulfur-carrier protein